MSEMLSSTISYMLRIPWSGRDKVHIVGEVGESDPNSEPKRAFWTNASVKALMAENDPQPEYISICGKVRGDWRSIEIRTSHKPLQFMNAICGTCEKKVDQCQ